jgi:hypothetical protein
VYALSAEVTRLEPRAHSPRQIERQLVLAETAADGADVRPAVARIQSDIHQRRWLRKDHQNSQQRGEHRGRVAARFGCSKVGRSCRI